MCHALVQKLSQAGMIGRRGHLLQPEADPRGPERRTGAPHRADRAAGSSTLPRVQLLGPTWPLLEKNPDYVARAHRQGQRVCPLDEESDSRLAIYQQMGCDVILSNNPGETAKAMRALGLRN